MLPNAPAAAWIDERLRSLRSSPTLAINELSSRLLREGRVIYKLGLGQSPFPVPPPVVAALREHAHEREYLPVRGLPALRAAVAEHHRRLQGLAVGAEDVMIGPGSKELMFLTQLVLDAELLVPSPSWVSYVAQARLTGRRVTWIETRREERWHLTPNALTRALQNAASGPKLGASCSAALAEAGALLDPPHGGFYLFPDFTALAAPLRARGIDGAEELCRRLLDETGVATLPGSVFGRPDTELTLRLSYVDFDGAAALAALREENVLLDDAFLQRYCARVLEAIGIMARWVRA